VRGEVGWDRSLTGIIRRTYEAAVDDNIPFLASAIAFDLLLTALPFIVLVLGFVGYLIQHQITAQQIDVRQLVQNFLPPETQAGEGGGGGGGGLFTTVETLFAAAMEHRGRLTLIGVPLFVWFSTRLFGGLRAALNDVFDTDERRPWLVGKALDAAMVVATGSLFLGNAALSAWVSYLEAWSTATLGETFALHWFWAFSLELLAFAFSIALFFLLYKLLPSRRISWRTALVAAVFGAAGFEVAKQLYALYLTRIATVDRLLTDANIGAFVLFLVWLHYTAFVFLLGGEVAETYDLVRLRRAQRVRLA
jgi:membrane protein